MGAIARQWPQQRAPLKAGSNGGGRDGGGNPFQRGGGCGFQEKARVAEKLQAAALVVVNSEDSLTTMTLPDPDARASVAALMVGASAGAALEAMAAGACGRAAGVLARLAYDAPELGDEDGG